MSFLRYSAPHSRHGKAALLCGVALLGCREGTAGPERNALAGTSSITSAAPTSGADPLDSTQELRALGEVFSQAPTEATQPRDPVELVTRPDHPPQRLAFSRYRLAWLDGDELTVLRLGDWGVATRFQVPEARNVVALVGGGFLIAGRDHVHRLSGIERRAELLPRAPRLGPTTILPSSQDSEQFWLYYQGIPKLPQFDLGEPPLASSLAVVGWVDLDHFDRRALLAFGDGSMLYTVPDGVSRIDAGGRSQHFRLPELGGRIWGLVRAERRDQVWAATSHHAYLLSVRGAAEVLERLELSPHSVALASRGRELGVLSVESVDERVFRFRVDVYSQASPERGSVRFMVPRPSLDPAGARAAIEPEIAFSVAGDWLAISALGLHVFDWRREHRIFPPASRVQNLAPNPP